MAHKSQGYGPQKRLSKRVAELARMTPDALWETYINVCDEGGDATPEQRPYFQRLINLIDAMGTFRFQRRWDTLKLAGATHVATVEIKLPEKERA